jgi:transposase
MIPHGVEVFVALEPVDLRLGFDRLAGFATERAGRSVRSAALFVFFGKRRTAVKILFADATGMCLFYKRLDRGTFRLPASESGTGVVTLEERELDDLLDGIDLESAAPRKARRTAPRTH